MRLHNVALSLAAALAAGPAAAQLSNRGIAVESGLSAPLDGAGGPRATITLTASTWLEGRVEVVVRVAHGSADGTGGRAAASATSGTLGLRLSLGLAPVRPQVFVDAGWARIEEDGVASGLAAFGAGAALEWFPAVDFSVAPRAALRLVGGAPAVELTLALGGYF